MIDIHSHILPGVDDGPQTLEESLRILKKAADEGVKTIVTTPHVLDGPSENYFQRIRNTFNVIKHALISDKIPIKIVWGAEVFIFHDLAQKIKGNKELTINMANKYILLELPVQEIPPFTEQTVFELLLQGIVPIIAHPERYLEIQKNANKLFDLVQKGVLTQLNSGSLTGRYGKKAQKTAKRLLTNNLIYMIGSDVHSTFNGYCSLSQGVNRAAELIGMRKARQMVTSIPARVIRGEEIATFPCISEKAGKIAAGGKNLTLSG